MAPRTRRHRPPARSYVRALARVVCRLDAATTTTRDAVPSPVIPSGATSSAARAGAAPTRANAHALSRAARIGPMVRSLADATPRRGRSPRRAGRRGARARRPFVSRARGAHRLQAALLAPRLPGRPEPPAPAHAQLLGLRPATAHRPPRRPRRRHPLGSPRDALALRRALPDPPHAPRRPLRRRRRPLDGRRQHLGLQLPPRLRLEALVRARLRARD